MARPLKRKVSPGTSDMQLASSPAWCQLCWKWDRIHAIVGFGAICEDCANLDGPPWIPPVRFIATECYWCWQWDEPWNDIKHYSMDGVGMLCDRCTDLTEPPWYPNMVTRKQHYLLMAVGPKLNWDQALCREIAAFLTCTWKP